MKIKQYKCIKELVLEKYDDNGFTIENEYTIIAKNTIWNILEDDNFRLVGGEIRLEEDIEDMINWIEIPQEILEEYFM